VSGGLTDAASDPFGGGWQSAAGDEYSARDATWVIEYLNNERDPAAAKIACIKAKIKDLDCSLAVSAQRQLARPVIQAAIKAAQAVKAAQPEPEITLGTLTAHAEDIRERAMEDRQYPAALNAVKLTAEMHGFLDKTININHSMKVEEMDTAALMKIAAGAKPALEVPYTEVPVEDDA